MVPDVDFALGHIIHINNSYRKGTLLPIQIITEKRQGRKTVTRVLQLDQYDIDVEVMAKELQKKCACSTSSMSWWRQSSLRCIFVVTVCHGYRPAGPLTVGESPQRMIELIIQGYAVNEVTDVLNVKHGVPKK